MRSEDMSLLKFITFNDYLDSFSTTADHRYLGNRIFSRMIIKFGFRSQTEILTESEFEEKRAIELNTSISPKSSTNFSRNMTSTDLVLQQLAAREKPNTQKTIATIIFLTTRPKSGYGVSGFIDYAESLRMSSLQAENCVDWYGVFQEKVILKPSPSNLSFYDWNNGKAKFNNSDNFTIKHEDGVQFIYRGDQKLLSFNRNKTKYSRNFSSSTYFSEIYGYVVFYDHVIRRKI